ncbi:MAG: HAMP domain-containing sensor histidine kinase [Erysipelotrichaceae bacterium]|nr:HAMP domain-containing sensor histidine kinase [Erysipelotrichaceae bacterium]
MKFDFKGIRFNVWLYFFGMSATILVMLGLLLVLLIKPYYRSNRIDVINNMSMTIESTILKDNVSAKDIESTSKLAIGNNVCALIFNENGNIVYESDAIGQMCLLDDEVSFGGIELVVLDDANLVIDVLKKNTTISETVPSNLTDVDMLLYGKMIRTKMANYYLVINTALEPAESFVDYFLGRFFFLSFGVALFAFFMALIFSMRITSPIIKMKKETNKLATGAYDVDFNVDSFTEINELASSLDVATKQLSKVDELRKELIANMSHDIKTPLTMIKAYAEMIRDITGDDAEMRNDNLDVILKETDYLNRLVTDMAELSKLQSGNIELTKSNFDLKNSVEEVSELLENALRDKNLDLKLDLMEAVIYADEIKISQVIYNYLSNAIKHSYENGIIEISIRADENMARLEVKDHGEGIKEEALPYIWDRYYKIDKGFNRSLNSTGLGLSIVKGILERHDAKYGVISKEGAGSTFFFELSRDYEDYDDE